MRSPIYDWSKSGNMIVPVLDLFNSRRFQEANVFVYVDDIMSQLFLSQYIDKSTSFAHTPAQMSIMPVSIPGEVKKSIRNKYEPLIAQALNNNGEIHTDIMQIAAAILDEYADYIPVKSDRLIDMIAW